MISKEVTKEEAFEICEHVARSMFYESTWIPQEDFFQEGCLQILKHWGEGKRTKAWVRATLKYSLSRYYYNELGPLQYKHRPTKLAEFNYLRAPERDSGASDDVSDNAGMHPFNKAMEDPTDPLEDIHAAMVCEETEQAVKRVLGSSTVGFRVVAQAIMEGTSIAQFSRTQGMKWEEARCILRGVAGALRSDERFMAVLTEL